MESTTLHCIVVLLNQWAKLEPGELDYSPKLESGERYTTVVVVNVKLNDLIDVNVGELAGNLSGEYQSTVERS